MIHNPANQATRMKFEGQVAFEVVDQSAEQVIGKMPVIPGMLNGYGNTNAGAILWFADVCATVLAMGTAVLIPGMSGFPLAINLNAGLLGNQGSGTFTATCHFVKKGRTLNVVRTQVTGDDGRMVADVTTTHLSAK